MDKPYIIKVPHGTHRAHSALCDLLGFYALTIAAIKARPGFSEIIPNLRFSCQAAQMDLVHDFKEMIDHIMDGQRPDFVYIIAQPKEPDLDGSNAEGVKAAAEHISAAVFSFYVEPWVDWVKLNVTTDFHRFPPVANFARVVRNAIVHGGTVNIENPNAASASWRGLTYGPQQRGQKVLNTGHDLSVGDLIILMLELSDELDTLGAPFTPI